MHRQSHTYAQPYKDTYIKMAENKDMPISTLLIGVRAWVRACAKCHQLTFVTTHQQDTHQREVLNYRNINTTCQYSKHPQYNKHPILHAVLVCQSAQSDKQLVNRLAPVSRYMFYSQLTQFIRHTALHIQHGTQTTCKDYQILYTKCMAVLGTRINTEKTKTTTIGKQHEDIQHMQVSK